MHAIVPRRVTSFLIAALIAVIALAVFVRALEPHFAFFPMPGETETPRDYGVPHEAIWIDTRDGERLRAWILRADRPRAFIVYFHGNGGNLSVWAPILAGVAAHGFTVLAFDYRGYGSSSGRPTERGLYRDVDAVVDRASQMRVADVPIVYWGRSLGATMAAYAASVRAPDAIVLESGFADARSVVRSSPPLALLAIFSTYRFPTIEHLRRVTAPALVIHGDADSVIPFHVGRGLFDRIEGPKQFLVVRGGDHNDAEPRDAATYWNTIAEFVGRANARY